SSTAGEILSPPSPTSASPLSLSSTRRYFGSAIARTKSRVPSGRTKNQEPTDWFSVLDSRLWLSSDLVAHKAPNDDVLTHFGHRLLDLILDRPRTILDKRLSHQDILLVELIGSFAALGDLIR